MKEKDLIKSVTDKQMPDLEQIRQNVLNGSSQKTENKTKAKILKFKPSKLIAAAAIVSLAVIGSIAAVANQNGVFFFNQPEPENILTEAATEKESTAPATEKPTSEKKVKTISRKTSTVSKKPKNNTDKYLKRLTKKGFKVTWLYDLGKIDGYHIVYAGNDSVSDYKCDYIMGEYAFRANKQQSPYGLGLYACGEKHSYILSDAYLKGIFKNFTEVVEAVEDYDKKNLGIETYESETTYNNFRDYFNGKDILRMAVLKSTEDYELYYNIASDFTDSDEEKTIDDYTFYIRKAQEPYNLGLYVVESGNIYTLEEALENEIIDMKKVYKAVHSDSDIPFNFGLFKNDDDSTAETTAPKDEKQTVNED